MTLYAYRSQSREGHLERVKRINAYVNNYQNLKSRYRTEEPDLFHLDNSAKHDWSQNVYSHRSEDLPDDTPVPLGKKVNLVHWFDANLKHDVLVVTGCINFANKTPNMWYSKK